MYFNRRYNKHSYVITPDLIDKFFEISLKFNSEDEDSENFVLVTIDYKDGLIERNIPVNEARIILTDPFTSEIKGIEICTAYPNTNYLSITFKKYEIGVVIDHSEKEKMNHYLNEIEKLIKHSKSSKVYEIFSEDLPGIASILHFSVAGAIFFIFIQYILLSNLSIIIAIFLWSTYLIYLIVFHNKVFPKSRLLLGSNIKKEDQLEKIRNFYFSSIIFPVFLLILDYFMK